MDRLECGKAFKCQVANIRFLDSNEFGQQLDCLDSCLSGDMVLIDDREIDCFK